MSNRDYVSKMLGNRFLATSAPAAGTTISLSVSAPHPQARHHIETLSYSLRNFVGAGGANATVQLALREASPAGTVLASWDHLVSPSSTSNVHAVNLGLAVPRGVAVHVTMDTVVASLTQKVTIAGWTEDS